MQVIEEGCSGEALNDRFAGTSEVDQSQKRSEKVWEVALPAPYNDGRALRRPGCEDQMGNVGLDKYLIIPFGLRLLKLRLSRPIKKGVMHKEER